MSEYSVGSELKKMYTILAGTKFGSFGVLQFCLFSSGQFLCLCSSDSRSDESTILFIHTDVKQDAVASKDSILLYLIKYVS